MGEPIADAGCLTSPFKGRKGFIKRKGVRKGEKRREEKKKTDKTSISRNLIVMAAELRTSGHFPHWCGILNVHPNNQPSFDSHYL